MKALNGMKAQCRRDFLDVLDAFGRQSSQQSSRQPSRSLSPSPVVGQDMLKLSQESFEDMFGIDPTTPQKRDQSPSQDTPYGKVPYGLNPFGAKFYVPESTQEAQQLVEKTAAPSPAVKTASPSPSVVDSSHEEEAIEHEDEASEVDSVLEEAIESASKATKELPAKGWLKTSIKKQRKAYEKNRKEQREAAKAARQAEKDAAKAAKTAKNAQKDTANAAKTAKAKGKAKACNKRTHANIEDDGEAHTKLVHDWDAIITKARIRQAKTGNIRTYIIGQTSNMQPHYKRWILIAEISQQQGPEHHALILKVTQVLFNFVLSDMLSCANSIFSFCQIIDKITKEKLTKNQAQAYRAQLLKKHAKCLINCKNPLAFVCAMLSILDNRLIKFKIKIIRGCT